MGETHRLETERKTFGQDIRQEKQDVIMRREPKSKCAKTFVVMHLDRVCTGKLGLIISASWSNSPKRAHGPCIQGKSELCVQRAVWTSDHCHCLLETEADVKAHASGTERPRLVSNRAASVRKLPK